MTKPQREMLRGVSRIARFAPVRSLASTAKLSPILTQKLAEQDPEIFDIIEKEKRRQRDSLCLIPSENFTSPAVLEALGSIMQNKYSEGYPGARYYGGNEFIDMSERLCQKRALEAFNLDPEQWGVNVQPLSGSPANFEVYTAVLGGPHERIMSLDLPHGGHLSHGFSTPTKKVSAVSMYFEVLPYRLDEKTGYIDYDTLEKNAVLYRPKLIVTGASAYPRHIDYARMRKIADLNNSYLMTDMAHISGLVAAGVMPSPFEHSDIVTTTTHKTLRGPRGAMIFFRKGVRKQTPKGPVMYELESAINSAVFPGHQGGPHNHTITALAVALKQAKTPEYRAYQAAVLENCQVLAKSLVAKGHKLVSGGTDNHLILVDVRPHGVNGAMVERVLELANVAINKNTVVGDKSAMNPGGIRIGSPAMTTRGLTAADFEKVAEFVDRGIKIAIDVNKQAGGGDKFKPFKELIDKLAADNALPELQKLKQDVMDFSRKFPAVGFDAATMKYA